MRAQTSKKTRAALSWLSSFVFILPVVAGILMFTMFPMVSSLIYSFTRTYTTVQGVGEWVGFENYGMIFNEYWPEIGKSLGTTFLFTVISLPLTLVLSFGLALLLTKDVKGIKGFRVVYYLPVMIPTVVSGILWSMLANGSDMSAFNMILNACGIPSFTFYDSADTAMFTFIVMGLFTIGSSMILWIAQIKSVPTALYEVADLEGASAFVKLIKITIPMCTPIIFYNLIMGLINSLQVFSNVITLNIEPSGKEALDFIVVQIYDFYNSTDLSMACALSWILFIIIAILSGLTFKFNKWVYYGEDV